MKPKGESDRSTGKDRKKLGKIVFEDIVVTAAVTVGILGGGLMGIFMQQKPIIVSIFLGMGISSLIYRFLGGISQDSSITIKGIKLTGTVAVWIACALIINSQLIKQLDIVDVGKKNFILVVRDENDRLVKGIELRVGDNEELMEPFCEENGELVEGKFAIPLKKLIHEGYIFIDQKSDTQQEKSITLKYDPRMPRITVYIESER